MRWPWVIPVVVVGVVVLLAWWARRRVEARPANAVLVAHTARLRALPRYQRLLGRRRRRGALLALAALVVVVGATLVLTRPEATRVGKPETKSRDIMLCLDASTSMDKDNQAVVAEMKQIVGGLRGDRVGLTIWSGAAVLVFPLTDDYGYVDEQLDRAEAAFQGSPNGFFSGVDLAGRRYSLIGDGIVSCVNRFDQPTAERTRAVVVSSDNQPIGQPAYTLDAAARYAAGRHVVVFGIGAGALADPSNLAARQGFANAVELTGGTLGVLGQAGGADTIVNRIDDLERARADLPPERVTVDRPRLGIALCVIGVGLLAVWWLAALVSLALGRRRRRRADAAAAVTPAGVVAGGAGSTRTAEPADRQPAPAGRR